MIDRGLLRTVDGRMSVIAHRGGRGTWRENTLEAFAAARSMGADGIELDARLTRDGLVVVHHDDDLESGDRIDALRSDELPEWLPDLAGVISAFRDLLSNIEIKLDAVEPGRRPDAARCRALATGVAELVVRNPGRVIVSSFWPDALVVFGEAAPGVATGLLVHPGLSPEKTREAVASASNLGCSTFHPFYLAATADVIDLCHETGLEVAVWTVNPPADLRGLEESGVDALITDDVAGTLSSLGRGR